MSGSQGRYPPAAPPQPQWRPEGERPPGQGQPPQALPNPGYPQQGHPQQGQWSAPPPGAQPPPFPPQFQAQPPALPGSPPSAPPGYSATPPLPPSAPPTWTSAQQQAPHQPQLQHGFPPQQGRPDQGGYDLGSYALPSGQPHTQPSARSGRAPQPIQPEPPRQWTPQPVDAYPSYPQQQGLPNAAPAQAPGYGYGQPQPQLGYAAAPPAAQQGNDGYEEEVEYEEAPPRRRRWLVAAALIGSIGLGGGIAYAYKSIWAPKSGDRSQVVKAPREPAKVAPTDRGGKQFQNAGSSTVMNRVPAEGSANASGGSTDSSGVRRVSTVPVERGQPSLPPMPPPPSSGVPGMVVVGGNNPVMPQIPTPSFDPPARSAPPPQPPQRTAVAPPPAPPRAPPPRVQPAEPIEAAAPPPKRVAAVPPPPAAAAEKVRPTGYVAVLGYQRTQMEAMKMMADLQQKYEPLRDKKLEIVQSDQTSRGLGVIYRVVVGPKGGISPAREVCQQLRQAGMAQSGCYPLASN